MGIGCKIGNKNVQPYMVTSFNATSYSTNTCLFYWTVPPHGLFDGVMVRYNTNGTFPKTIHEGTQAFNNIGTQIALTSTQTVLGGTSSGFTTGTTYYFSCFPFYINGDGDKVYNGRQYLTTTWTAQNFANKVAVTGTSNWTVPTGVRSIQVFVVGGGGGGGGSDYHDSFADTAGGGGGGSGYTNSASGLAVTPGQQIYCAIGSGGSGGDGWGHVDYPNAKPGGTGGTTAFYHPSNTVSASGGTGGGPNRYDWEYRPHNVGGSGGATGGAGAVNAGNGGNGQWFDGVQYNGAGGGGGYNNYGAGGSRGGGHGAQGHYSYAVGAEAGWGATGGGGGGGSGRDGAGGSWAPVGAWGGSGVIIIKWS